MQYAEFKAPKGIIKVELSLAGDTISKISISGDFFMYPEDALEQLEKALFGTKVDFDSLISAVKSFYKATGACTPMLEPEHWVEAIMKAARS